MGEYQDYTEDGIDPWQALEASQAALAAERARGDRLAEALRDTMDALRLSAANRGNPDTAHVLRRASDALTDSQGETP